jgi:polyisoprenoid-binding protein YceI
MRSLTFTALMLAAAGSLVTVSAARAAKTPAAAQASTTTTWEIDPSHTSAEFSVRHMMVSNVKGQFGKVTGEVVLDDKDVKNVSANVQIDASTIDTREPKRDAHLKSPDFFDVAKYPTITFKSTKVEKAGKGKFKVTGDLTMHGVTKPVTLSVDSATGDVNDIMGGISRGASLTGKLNRKDWGLTWNKPLAAAGGVLVGDEVSLDIQVELHQKKEVAPVAAAAAPIAAPVNQKVPAAAKDAPASKK